MRCLVFAFAVGLLGVGQLAGAAVGQPADQAVPGASMAAGKLGSIELDRARGLFRVPGTVLRLEPPLEYVAVAKAGRKDYESLLALDTSGISFNLACLLIGLDPDRAERFAHQFDRKSGKGEGVRLWVEWSEGDRKRVAAVGDLLKVEGGQRPPEEWVYTGSYFATDGRYVAEVEGSLVGFVHDPVSIIEHRSGLGIGAYGSVGADPSRSPPVGTRITFIVERLTP